jgi:hypothetical protein
MMSIRAIVGSVQVQLLLLHQFAAFSEGCIHSAAVAAAYMSCILRTFCASCQHSFTYGVQQDLAYIYEANPSRVATGQQEPMDMLMVAADACWSQEGSAARARLLPNAQLKSILVQCLGALAAHCGRPVPSTPATWAKVHTTRAVPYLICVVLVCSLFWQFWFFHAMQCCHPLLLQRASSFHYVHATTMFGQMPIALHPRLSTDLCCVLVKLPCHQHSMLIADGMLTCPLLTRTSNLSCASLSNVHGNVFVVHPLTITPLVSAGGHQH